jgi:hypothetical protein
MGEIVVAESFGGAYTYHKAEKGSVVALCGEKLMQSVKELPLSLWRVGDGRWCGVCDAIGRLER